jgi:ABC-2 type transport system permease protein
MLLLVTIPAWVAVASKGYLGPMGFIIFSLVLATILQATGWAPWFPWSIILLECAVGPNVSILGIGSRVVLNLRCVAGWVLTWRTLDRADNLQ